MSAMLSFMLLATGASLRSNQHELLDLMPKPEPDYSSINYGNFTGREGRESKKIDFDDIKALIDYLTREDEFRRGLRTTGVDVMRLVSIYQEVPKANDLKPWIDWFHSEDGGGEKYKQDAIKAALEVLFDGNHSSLEDIKKWSDLFYSYFEDKVGSSKKGNCLIAKKPPNVLLKYWPRKIIRTWKPWMLGRRPWPARTCCSVTKMRLPNMLSRL